MAKLAQRRSTEQKKQMDEARRRSIAATRRVWKEVLTQKQPKQNTALTRASRTHAARAVSSARQSQRSPRSAATPTLRAVAGSRRRRSRPSDDSNRSRGPPACPRRRRSWSAMRDLQRRCGQEAKIARRPLAQIAIKRRRAFCVVASA